MHCSQCSHVDKLMLLHFDSLQLLVAWHNSWQIMITLAYYAGSVIPLSKWRVKIDENVLKSRFKMVYLHI